MRKISKTNHRRLIFLAAAACTSWILFSTCTPDYSKETRDAIRRLTLEQKIGQMIMPGVAGKEMNPAASAMIGTYKPGGIILFGFNLSDKNGTRTFIRELQRRSMDVGGLPLFISIDQEGGRVKRIRDGVTQFPGNMALGAGGDPELAYTIARVLGMQLRMMGVNMNLAPVLDVNNNYHNPVINLRSFGSSKEIVSRLGAAYIRGIQDAKCIAVGKHFPGHGDTNKDSHVTLPVIPYDERRLEQLEWVPFRAAIASRVEGIMTAHIAYPSILNNDDSATISRYFLTDVLRTRMNYDGLIISDDMEMHAIAKRMDLGTAAVKAVNAGADIVLISSYEKNIPVIFNALKNAAIDGTLSTERIDQSVRRILASKLRYSIMKVTESSTILSEPDYSDSQLRLLETADTVNATASKRAICYLGRDGALFRRLGSGAIRSVVINASPVFRAHLTRSVPGCRFADSVDGIRDTTALAVYYTDRLQQSDIAQHSTKAAARRIPFLVVFPGNPFELHALTSMPDLLISFSNTDESLRQLAVCIGGGFIPRYGSPIDLGISVSP
ncbi:MAG TPA: beta-N-acetylhexosaminidase [Spirochaetota bacterium]|nr:beta-N-acetylhexosaminidase [Spirochaetota bacterium]HNT10678.1 beta-N-acetylhexosaminidase [Spirochaetota bacterium]